MTSENDAADSPKPLPREVAWLVEEGYSPIRAWREHLGVTREELGRRLEVSPAAVAQMEARKSRPRGGQGCIRQRGFCRRALRR